MNGSRSQCVHAWRKLALTLALVLCAGWLLSFAFPARRVAAAQEPAAAGDIQPQSEFVRLVSLPTSDVIYNPADQMLYASVPSSAGDIGNSIAPINPATGEVGTPIFIGSEPNKLALADDGRSLYVFLEGAYSVRRFDTQTRTPGLQFPIGQDSFYGVARAADLAVAPGNPNLVAVARYYPSTSSPAGIAIFDNGVPRTQSGPGDIVGAQALAFAAATKLYGGGNTHLETMTVGASGVTVTSMTSFNVGSQIKLANGRIYSSSGQVVDPDAGTLLGTFASVNTNAFVPDPAAGRAYYLGRDNFSSSGPLTLKAFDMNTFVLLGSATLSGITGDPTTLVRWGTNGLAFRTTTNQIFLLQTSLIPSSDPIPTPTPTPTATPTPTPVPVQTFVRQLALPTNDLIYNPQNQLIYASVPSTVGANGNSVTRINPETAEVGPSVFVGSEPGRLALADDNQTMYVGLNGAGAVRRLDVSAQTAGLQFSLGNGSDGPYKATDIAVMPGSPGTVAVSRAFGGTAIYDDGVARAQTSAYSGEIEFGATTRLYVGSNPVQKLAVSQSGLAPDGSFLTASNGTITTQFVNGQFYLSSGVVVEPEAGLIKGRFSDIGFGSLMTVDPTLGRVFFLSNNSLRAYDINTFRLIASVQILGINGTPTRLVRWGQNGLAFNAGNSVFLIQTALVNDAQSIPTPTPTPSPTPTPTPVYIPTFVRKVDLPANDLVINQAMQTLYASVPSTAANGVGNSITSIDPQTGTIGASTFVGSEPDKLALADDGQTLYVNLDGAQVVRRFDITTKTPGQQFSVNAAKPADMKVVPGSPQALAVSRGIYADGTVAIYDNGVQRPNASNPAYRIGPIEFGTSAATLYGGSGGSDFLKFNVNSSGVRTASLTQNFFVGATMKFANGRLYGSSGRVVDPETQTLLGTFNIFNVGGTTMLVDAALGRVFFLTSNSGNTSMTLTAYDSNTFLPLGSVTLPGITGTPSGLVRWGANGLAFCNITPNNLTPVASQVYLLQSTLVSDAAPVPSTLQFSASSYNVSESGNSATITVTRMGGVTGAASVNYATSDGTATAGSDYTATAGTLNFADGELSKTFTVPLTDDNVFEGNETINLTLSNPSGGPTLGAPATAVLTVNDNEFRPSVLINNVSVVEGDAGTTAATFNVTLSKQTTQTVTLNYATAPLSAAADVDYVSTSGALTFNPLEQTKQITVQINGDTLAESNESFIVNLSNIVNATNVVASGIGTILDDDAPGFRFSATNYSANEGGGRATLTVTRKGDTSTAASINYATIDLISAIRCDDTTTRPGVAFARCDYATSMDTLDFVPGETSKTFNIPLIDDAFVEGPETVQVVLNNAVGAPLATPSSAFLTIVDNDQAGEPNPIFANEFFVRQQYLDFLSREPDTAGYNAWLSVLNNCSDVNSNPNCDRILVSQSFFGSQEFQLKGFYVFLFYKVALNRLPSYDEIIYDMRQVTGQTPEEVYSKRARFAQTFTQRTSFTNIYGSMDNGQFVSSLLVPYGATQINTADPANPDTGAQVTLTQDQLVNALTNNTLTRAQVLRAVVQSREVSERETNGAFVAMQYYGYLRRTPETGGYNSWLSYLNAHPGDYHTMVNGFMNSTEYRLRFGNPSQ